jgi:4-hydroxybenzoyl-CoA reductase subunit alpha
LARLVVASMVAPKSAARRRFADDLILPRMLFCRLLRSPLPHARIVSIDASRAKALPGVHLVLTGADLPTTFGILPVSQDEHALCLDKVRFVGDPVAAVVAQTASCWPKKRSRSSM